VQTPLLNLVQYVILRVVFGDGNLLVDGYNLYFYSDNYAYIPLSYSANCYPDGAFVI